MSALADREGFRRLIWDPIRLAQASDPLAEFDEYGTELHKDARVWKVYVDETDKHDTELVNGWNDIREIHRVQVVMQVLTWSVQAALFSAISTAFLIESSKLLQPDPAEQSAQSLLLISQTLSTIANGTQSPGSIPPPSSDPVEFTPSRAAIWVNALWYLSLGLSLVTSFIAILAKDWCHSFMSGRTGHPHSQMCRRQQKWNMIEKWKMSELLTILPSLIHIALLLFSVGLCIYLSDTYLPVAIPIFCATGAAIAFYIWSSIAAITTDYFPYPTIISRVCRTEFAHRAVWAALSLGSRFGSHPVIRNLYQVAVALTFVCVCMLQLLLLMPMMFFYVFRNLSGPLDRYDMYLARRSPLLQLVAVPLSKSVRLFVWHPANAAYGWIFMLEAYLDPMTDDMWSQLSGASWGLEWQEWTPKNAAQESRNEHNLGDVTSLALSWLITNCEVPGSVDIALQSIAGATSRTSRQPLLDCRATLQILRRLASSNLYKGSDARTDMLISRYSRALVRLGGASGSISDTAQNGSESELEGLIWDVHLESETMVAASIVDGSFDPTSANLDALRIGNTTASKALRLLGRDSQGTDVDIDQLLSSILDRLEAHVEQSDPLHNAALLSLFNAAALILPFAPDLATSRRFESLCARVIELHFTASTLIGPAPLNLVFLCAFISGQPLDHEPFDNLNSASLLRNVVNRLLECYTEATAIARTRVMFGLEMLATHPEAFQFASLDLRAQNAMLDQAASTIDALYESLLSRYQTGIWTKIPEDDMLQSLQAVRSPLGLVPLKSWPTLIPFLILGPIRHLYRSTLAPVDDEWVKLGSDSCFPTLSSTLTQLIEKSNLIPHLERMVDRGDDRDRFMALGQLWLLFTTYLDAFSDLPDEREKLGAQLRRYKQSHPESENVRHAQLGDELAFTWESGSITLWTFGAWPSRLMECVYQSRNAPPPQNIYEKLQEFGVPDNLRGLSSFTGSRPHLIEIGTGDRPRPVSGTPAATNNENASGNDLPVKGTSQATVVAGTEDRVVDQQISPGGDYMATHNAIGLGNPAYDMPDGGKLVKGEGNSAILGGQGGGTGNKTNCWEIEPGGAENGADAEPHISIDVRASETVSKQ